MDRNLPMCGGGNRHCRRPRMGPFIVKQQRRRPETQEEKRALEWTPGSISFGRRLLLWFFYILADSHFCLPRPIHWAVDISRPSRISHETGNITDRPKVHRFPVYIYIYIQRYSSSSLIYRAGSRMAPIVPLFPRLRPTKLFHTQFS